MSDQIRDPNHTIQQPGSYGFINYRIPEGIQSGLIQGRSYLSTLQGGKIIIDDDVKAIWLAADHHSFSELLKEPFDHLSPDEIRSILACLVQSGVLARGEEVSLKTSPHVHGILVSAVIVAFNGQDWLPVCLSSLLSQTYSPLEIIVVDNNSTDNSISWLKENYPEVKILRMDKASPLSKAINDGIAVASGDYFLVLNQDIRLETGTVGELVAVAQEHSNNGAVASKLKFMWAPAFLNGLGNWVGDHSWGSDIGLGNLDFGQLDDWKEVPSACFAATLIPRTIWALVGTIDEGFPLYYEDSDWCYRTRLLGFKIYAAPKGVIYHAFGSKVPTGKQGGITANKQRQVSYGRIRFALKIAGSNHLFLFLRNYLIEDWANFIAMLIRGRLNMATAYLSAWGKLIRDMPSILKLRRQLQTQRKVPDEILFAKTPELPETLEWNGLPVLTRDIIKRIYIPLLRFDRTIKMLEFVPPQRRRQLLIVSSVGVGNSTTDIMKFFTDIGTALNQDLGITIAIPGEISIQIPGIRLVSYDADRPLSLQILVENHDIALISESLFQNYPFLKTTRTRLVINLFTSTQIDSMSKEDFYLSPKSTDINLMDHEIINDLARAGDFFICGNERQRDQWLGVLAANGRFNQNHLLPDWLPSFLIAIINYNFPGKELQIDPLRKYCLERSFAADRQLRFKNHLSFQPEQNADIPPMGKMEETLFIWRTQGFAKMTTRVFIHLRWIFFQR